MATLTKNQTPNQTTTRFKLPKQTKLCSLTDIDALFARGGKGALSYPLRLVSAPAQPGAGVKFFISVPKKRLRHAVDRVTMRRRIREAYRLARPMLPDGLDLNIAFIYVANNLEPFSRVTTAMQRLLGSLSTLSSLPSPCDESSPKS